MESVESQESGFPPFTLFGKSLRDYHIPTASTAGIFQGARARETECKALGLQGGCTNGAALPPLARCSKGHHGQSDEAAPCQTRYHGNLYARELWNALDAQRVYMKQLLRMKPASESTQ